MLSIVNNYTRQCEEISSILFGPNTKPKASTQALIYLKLFIHPFNCTIEVCREHGKNNKKKKNAILGSDNVPA